MTYEYEQYLAHHGIKGQKWGVRRFQNEDGSLTSEGRDRYGISEKDVTNYRMEQNTLNATLKMARAHPEKSKRRLELEERYRKQGLSQDQAEAEAFNRERIEKVIKVAGAVAATAAIAYGAYRGAKWINKYGDKVIRKGTEISRVTVEDKINTKLPIYSTFEKGDKTIYRGEFVENRSSNEFRRQISEWLRKNAKAPNGDPVPRPENIKVYNHFAKANKNMKVAGERTGRKVYEDLLKNDKEFAQLNAKSLERNKAYASRGKTDYDNFNIRLVFGDDDSRSMTNKFYSALKKKGYSGVIDVNDRNYSEYRAKKPTILFDYDGKTTSVRRETFNREDLIDRVAGQRNVQNKRVTSLAKTENTLKLIKRLGLTSASISGLLTGSVAGRNAVVKNYNQRNRELINQYKKDHPNTRLTDKEILKNLMG